MSRLPFDVLASASHLPKAERAAYLKAMQAEADRYGPDGRTPIGKRATVNGRPVIMTADGWRSV